MSTEIVEYPYRVTREQFELMPAPALAIERRGAIRSLAAAMFAADLTDTGLERITQAHPKAQAKLHFSEGIYMRELFIEAGMRVVGMRHKQEHMNVIACGRATVFTEDGQDEVCAPAVFKGRAGTQRVVIVHEDMVWVTIHRCDETDPEKAFEFVFMDESDVIARQ